MRTKTLKACMARIFTAVDVDDQELLDNLSSVRDRLDLGFRPVSREKMHVTLEFFADADEEEIEEIKQAMDAVDREAFKAEVRGLGAFPSDDYIRVIWAGLESSKFQELYRQVSDHGVESDNNHSFQPHITLLRVEDLKTEEKRKVQRVLQEYSDHFFGELNAKSIKLFKTELGSKGSSYHEIHEKELV